MSEDMTFEERCRLVEDERTATAWDEPLPLGWSGNLPDFPTEAFPPVLARYVHGLALELQVGEDLPGTLVLGALAACIGGKVRVRRNRRQPGRNRKGWIEPTNLFVVPVLPPGSRKSATLGTVWRPITEAETRLRELLGAQISEARTE